MSEPNPTDARSIDDEQATTEARPGSDSQPAPEAASSRACRFFERTGRREDGCTATGPYQRNAGLHGGDRP